MAKDAEAVMDALKSTLLNYTSGLWHTVTSNRDLEAEPYEENDYPALNIVQGDEDYTILGSTLQDNDLQVFIAVYAQDNGAIDPKDAANRVMRQIQTALFDPWYSGGNLLGLTYVWDIRISTGGQLDTSSSGYLDKASRIMFLNIKYRSEHQALGG